MLPDNVMSRNIKTKIKDAGINANQLAQASGVPAARLSDILRGRTTNPRLFTVVKLSDALGVTVDDLIREPDHE